MKVRPETVRPDYCCCHYSHWFMHNKIVWNFFFLLKVQVYSTLVRAFLHILQKVIKKIINVKLVVLEKKSERNLHVRSNSVAIMSFHNITTYENDKVH